MKIIILLAVILIHCTLDIKGLVFPLRNDTQVRPTSKEDCGCGYAVPNYPDERIIGGKEVDSKHSLPFMVELIIEWRVGKKNITCGGTLINRRMVVTAAHCVLRKGLVYPKKIYAYMGTHHTKWNGPGAKLDKYEDLQVIDASTILIISRTIYIPDNYQSKSLKGDVALLKLPRDVEFNAYITPACLSSCKENLIGKSALIAGWGQSEDANDNFLKQATIDIVPYNDKSCKDHGCTVPQSGINKKYCGHSLTSNICKGDAGGPLIRKENDRYVIVGVASSNGGCNNFNQAGIYIDICPYIPSILYYSKDWKGWCKKSCKDC